MSNRTGEPASDVMDINISPALDGFSLQTCVEAAARAQSERDFKTALVRWQLVRELFPDDPRGFSGCGTVLRQMRRFDDADLVLSEGLNRFPKDETIVIARAWVAHARGDFLEANRRWEVVLRLYPLSFDGYFGGGSILTALRRFDEADELYRLALSRFPVSVGLLGDFAAVAQSRGDSIEASRRWVVLHTLFPIRVDCFLRQARCLREANLYDEADSVLRDAQTIFPGNSGVLIDFALSAQHSGRTSEALKRWEIVITEFPGLVDGYVGAAHALNDLGRFADALNVLQPAVRKFPDSIAASSLCVWTEHYRGNFAEALIGWTNFRERFPTDKAGYIGGAASMISSGKIHEAAALLERGRRLFPNDIQIAIQWARVPQHLQNWPEAVSRWEQLCACFPENPAVIAGSAIALVKSGNSDKGERILEEAITRDLGGIEVFQAFAECAGLRREWPVNEARWRKAVEKFPDRVSAWTGLGEALRNAGRLEESQKILSAALQRFPDNLELERHLALTYSSQRLWTIALPLWERLKRKYPRNQSVLSGITQTVWRAQEDLGAISTQNIEGATSFEIPSFLLEEDDSVEHGNALRALFLKFESLGDTCEFGIVQRRFGAEPISLLRWASTQPAKLVQALDSKFEGVGDAEHTIIQVSHGEYTTQDRRYHMFSHTFTPETAEPLDRFTVQHLRRMKYLRKKLIEDLATGEKVFVYKSNSGVSEEDARAIFQAIRGYGGQTALLCVRLSDAANEPGSVRALESGLFIGYIDRFSTVDINVDVWVELCRKIEKQVFPTGTSSSKGSS
jgi:tetratricopeptide (TPR) repeat protein